MTPSPNEVRAISSMNDDLHLMTDENHFMTEPTAGFNLTWSYS